jgi:hypothetical protein
MNARGHVAARENGQTEKMVFSLSDMIKNKELRNRLWKIKFILTKQEYLQKIKEYEQAKRN